MRFNAVFDNVVVKLDDNNEMRKTSGGIFIPNQKSDLVIGTVVAFGEGTNRFRNKSGEPLVINNLKVGDKIVFKEGTACDFEMFNEKYKLIDYASVIGYISDDNKESTSSKIIKED